jgi:hypothetical protein
MFFSGEIAFDALQYRKIFVINELLVRDACHAFREYILFGNYPFVVSSDMRPVNSAAASARQSLARNLHKLLA